VPNPRSPQTGQPTPWNRPISETPDAGSDLSTGATLLRCEAVLFDCDGVLVDSAAIVLDSWTRWALRLGVDPAILLPTVQGRRSQDTVAQFIEPSRRESAVELIDAIELEDAATTPPIPGAGDLLASIPDRNRAIFTSGSQALARTRLAAAGIPIPRVLVAGEDVTHGKPHPEGYRAAAAGLGVDPRNCVVVEDAAPGIRAARAAGVRHVLGVGDLDVGEDRPDLTVPDLRDVRWTGAGLEVLLAAPRS